MFNSNNPEVSSVAQLACNEGCCYKRILGSVDTCFEKRWKKSIQGHRGSFKQNAWFEDGEFQQSGDV